MGQHFCEKCGYVTSRKANILRHFARKTPCHGETKECSVDLTQNTSTSPKIHQDLTQNTSTSPKIHQDLTQNTSTKEEDLESRTCTVCCKVFKNRSSLYTHRTKKVCVGESSGGKQCKKCLKVFATVNSRAVHEKRNTCEGSEVKSEGNTTNYNISGDMNNNTVNNNINITVNTFGNEELDYITNDEAALLKAIRSGQMGLQDIIKRIYFDQEHPENRTVQLPNVAKGICTVWDGENWQYKSSETVTYDMMYRAAAPLHFQYIKHNERHPTFEAVRRAIQGSENHPGEKRINSTPADRKVLRKLVKDTQCTLMNNRLSEQEF